jgi:hypothetical protein
MLSPSFSRAFALTIALPVAAAAALVGVAPATAAVVPLPVYTADLGTTNFDGNGAWGTDAPSAPGWDKSASDAPFTALPAAGSKWTLDIEGKAAGTTAITSDGLVLTTVGYANANADEWKLSQKVRYSYFIGSGGYPAIDNQVSNGVLPVEDFLGSELSWTGKYVEDSDAVVHGKPSIEFRIQNPEAPYQRVSFHSNGYDENGSAPTLTATTSTVTPSAADHLWTINSAAQAHGQYSSLSTTALAADFAGWDVVSFGPNSGRGADGVLTLDSLTALGTTFSFDLPVVVPPFTGVVPVVSGTATVGKTLTARPGAWGSGWTFSYQWSRSAAKTPIAGATKATYVASAADLGKQLYASVTGTKGSAQFTTWSVATAKIAAGTLTSTPVPKISGKLAVGKTLTAKAGGWNSGVKLSYRWYNGSTRISGAVKATYKLKSSDKRDKISVTVTGTKAGYTTVTKTSKKTAAIK